MVPHVVIGLSFSFQSLVNIVSPATAMRDEIVIPADDINVEAPTHCSSNFTLKPPSSGHHGVHSIHCLYLSHTVRIGHKVSEVIVL